jgi:hypothetical protein
MANVKNFGLIGVGSDLQLGKGGARLIQSEGAFSFRNATNSANAALTMAGITSSAGNITATTGSFVASAAAGTFQIAGDTTLSRQGAGVFSLDGTKAVVVPIGTVLQRPTGAAGMFRYNSDTAVMEYYNGSSWQSLATGGAAVTAVSVASANGFSGTSSGGTTPQLTLTTTITGVLTGNGTAISAATTTGTGDVVLATSPTLVTPTLGVASATSVNKVAITAPATGATLTLADGSTFVTSGAYSTTITSTGATSVTLPTSGTLLSTDTIASNAVTSFSAGTTGFTPNSSTQGAVTLDGTLNVANGGTGATSLTTNGIVYGNNTSAVGVTAAGTQYQVLQAGATGVPAFGAVNLGQSAAVTGTLGATNGGTGLSSFSTGNVLYASANNTWAAASPGATSGVQAYDADLDALAGLTTTGIIVRTGAGTATTRSITGTATRIEVSNGNGVSGEPTIDLATVTNPGSGGTFVKITTDGYGRVTNSTAVTTSDITTLVDATYVNVSGDTMTGTLTMSSGATVTGLPDPTLSSDAASKNYVDNAVTGLSWKQAVHVLANSDVPLSGSTPLVIDGQTVADQERVLLTNQPTTGQYTKGIYVATIGGGTYTLARSADCNTYQELNGAAVFVQTGTVYADSGWVQTATLTSLTTGNVQNWVQFSGAGAYTATAPVVIAGNVISLNQGQGLTTTSNNLTIDIATGTALSKSAGLAIVLDTTATGGLDQTSGQLRIAASGVTNAMLVNSGFTTTADTGSQTLSLGDTLHIDGDSTAGLSFAVTKATNTVTYAGTIADATSSQKGVAKFGADFTVTAGDVALTNKSITFGADSGTASAVNLGSTLNIVKASGSAISTAVTAGQVAIDVATATSSVKGVATFNTNGFVVTAGDVALKSDVVQSISTGSGSATPSSNAFTIAGSGAISTAGAGSTVTVSVADATTAVKGVASFSSTNFAVTTGAVSIKAGGINLTTDVTGTLPVANGGTGVATVTANQVPYGAGTSPLATSANFTFDGTSTLTVGGAKPLAINGALGSVTATATNSDLVLTPNGTGSVVIGQVGAGIVQSDAATALTVRGNTTLTLESGSGSTSMKLSGTTANKVDVSGPTAAQYATGLADTNLVNKYYVDTVAGSASGDVKAVSATVDLSAGGTTNIGLALPAGATVLSVKVNVTAPDTGSGTLAVGISGTPAAFMSTSENDTQTAGLYVAECMVTNAGSVQVIATVATPTGSGTAKVVVTYQIAE